MVHDKGTSRGKDTARSKGAAKRTKSTVNRSKSAAREAQPPTTFSLDLRPEFMNLKIVHETRITRSDFVELEWFKGIMNEVAEMDKKVNYCNAVGTKGWKDENSATNENTKLAYGAMVETMTSCSQLQNHLPAALTATRDHDVNVHRVSHSFPSVLSYTETLPLVGHVSHVAVPESRSDYLESSCERSSTPSTVQNVHISARLMEEFMELARANTNNNMETCGVLGAYLKDRTFYVTTLIVPKQESTSNSCQALNEEEIYTIHDEQSLFPVGWIHTHPSQTCFLSSIDLHTQYSYQVMLPEAVAIVMAPTDPTRSYGIFRVTDPGGMAVLRQCEERGFHSHPETSDGSPIYESCSNVYVNPNLRFEIIDLRCIT